MVQPHPKHIEIKYFVPRTSKEAVEILEAHADQSRPYAGGTDCLIQMRDKKIPPQFLVDLKSIEEFRKIGFDQKKGLTIGAAVPLNLIISHPKISKYYPVLVGAAEEIGGYQLRNRATLVGNLCNASPCGDTIGPSLVYRSVLQVENPKGSYEVELKDFFTGPGKTCLQPGEVISSITFPIPPVGAQGSYQSIGRNKIGDLAIAAVTVLGWKNEDTSSGFDFLITLTAVAPTVIFAESAQNILETQSIDHRVLELAASACGEACSPIDDIRGSADYRRDMIKMLSMRGLEETCRLLKIPM